LLLARLGPDLEGHPDAILVHRLFNVTLGAIGFAALLAVGLVAKLPRLAFYAYIVPLAAVPVLAPLAGAVNNDNARGAKSKSPHTDVTGQSSKVTTAEQLGGS